MASDIENPLEEMETQETQDRPETPDIPTLSCGSPVDDDDDAGLPVEADVSGRASSGPVENADHHPGRNCLLPRQRFGRESRIR
jgi:hypothetical protein